MAGVHVLLRDPDTGLLKDGPRAHLQVVLVPFLPCDWVLDLVRVEETRLVGKGWTGNDEVPFQPSLTSLITITLQVDHSVLQARNVGRLRLEVDLLLLSFQLVAVHSHALDEGRGNLHQPAKDGLDPAILLLLIL